MQNALRNLCGIYAESIYALSMLDSMQHAYFTQIFCRFHAYFHAECVAESFKNPCRIYRESMRNLSMPCPCLIPCSMPMSRKFHAEFTKTTMQNTLRNLCGILAGCFRNPCGIFAESMRNLSMPYHCLIPCGMQISHKFHADFTQTSM